MCKRPIFALLLILSASGAMACGSSSTDPTASITTTTVFGSRIQEHGSAWRSFPVTKAGSVKIQLATVSQADAVVRLGLGTVSGTECVVSQSIDTAANNTADSPQITADLGLGTYCTKLSDIGNLTTIVDFQIYIITPA